jgi:hypothetical protein
VHDPVDAVLVVAGGEDLADDEFAGAGRGGGFVAEVGVFEEDAVVFFVDADCVFDGVGFTVPGVVEVSGGLGERRAMERLTFGRKRRPSIGSIPCSHNPC